MTFIRDWSYCIVTTIILFTIVELIIPEGGMKKHVLFVTGIIVSITIAAPILELLNNDFDIRQVFNELTYDNAIYYEVDDNLISSQVNSLEKIFSQEIIRKFNLEYPESKIISCVVIFNKDEENRIIDIERINVATYENDSTITDKLSKICETDKSKISVEVLENNNLEQNE